MKKVMLSRTHLSAAFLDEFKLLSISLGIPTVTSIRDLERESRTWGLASESLTLVMSLDCRSSTTLGGGRGWEDEVPQFTPTAPEPLAKLRCEKRAQKMQMAVVAAAAAILLSFKQFDEQVVGGWESRFRESKVTLPCVHWTLASLLGGAQMRVGSCPFNMWHTIFIFFIIWTVSVYFGGSACSFIRWALVHAIDFQGPYRSI